MYVLGKTWRDGYLDYARAPGEIRIQVQTWWALRQLKDVFLPQPRSLRRLWNYLRFYGVREMWIKVRSRLSEALRDRRFFSIGVGRVLEADADCPLQAGSAVVFVAPNHPECVERVCLPAAFVAPAPPALESPAAADGIILLRGEEPPLPADWDELAGWSAFSGRDQTALARSLAAWGGAALAQRAAPAPEKLPLSTPSPVSERTRSAAPTKGGKSAVLFGLGNYAKTLILPNLDPRVDVRCIHEIEPTQLGTERDARYGYDTSGNYRPDERYDMAFIAGYHHTHTDLAIHALQQGAAVLVEKPLVTTRSEWERLRPVTQAHPGRFFAGFHLRYSPLCELALQDLKVKPGEPVHYHCIVFEVPLVRRHWYNWPTSRSRIVCNGCHWLDHFLRLNHWAAPRRWKLMKARNGDIASAVELENGASFSMTLTDHGSARLGVCDHVELRANGVTVRIDRGRYYESEDGLRILRRTSITRLAAHHAMYRQITARIIAGQPGDSEASLKHSCELMLNLDEMLAYETDAPTTH